MKTTKFEEPKKKKSLRNLFRKSKSKGVQPVDPRLPQLDGMKFAEPRNEEVYIENGIALANPSIRKPFLSNDETYESEIEVEILKPKNVIKRKAIFGKNVDPIKYCNELSTYLSENGLSVDKNSIREMFGCMAASKLIIVKNESTAITERFIELFSEFIGASFFTSDVNPKVRKFEELFTKRYNLKAAIESANSNENVMNVMFLKNVRLEALDYYFTKVIDFALNPLLPCVIKNENSTSITDMPHNIWFMVSQIKSSKFVLSETLVQSAITIEVNAKIIQPIEEVYQNELKLSYEYMSNLLLEGYEEFYLEEIEWKKIDKVEAYLNEFDSFLLDNRLFRQLERYSSTYLMFGGDKYEAMDSVLYAKLLRVISLLKLKQNQDGEEGIFQLFETLFGLEYLSKSKRLLKQIQEANSQK